MPRDSGRTGSAGNKKGKKPTMMSKKGCEIHIRMKDPMIHLRGGEAPPKGYTRKKT